MITLGVISAVKERTAWCAGMVVVLTSKGVFTGRGIQLLQLSSHWHNMWEHKCSVHLILTLDFGKSHWIYKAHTHTLHTSFKTPINRNCFNWLPFGITSAEESYVQIENDAF